MGRQEGYRHTEETRKKMSESRKGKKNPNWGKHLSKETREKIRQKAIGRKHTKEWRQKISKSLLGMKGEKNRNWKGGKESYYQRQARRIWEEWWRQEVPDGYVVHHLDRNRENNDICNLALLTRGYHNIVHKIWEKKPNEWQH